MPSSRKLLWPLVMLGVLGLTTWAAGVDRDRRKPASQATAGADRDRDRDADQDRDRSRDRDADRGRDRDRGPGREVPGDRDRPEGEGTEEGMPEMRVVPPDRGGRIRPWPLTWRLGVYALNTSTGVRVTRTLPGTPAWNVGLERGDVIVAVDGYQVGYVKGRLYPLGEELQRRAGAHGQVTLLVQDVRTRDLINLDVRLERFPPPIEPLPLRGEPRGAQEKD